jgi:hypothetical protein
MLCKYSRSGGCTRARPRVADGRAVIVLLMDNADKVPQVAIVLND